MILYRWGERFIPDEFFEDDVDIFERANIFSNFAVSTVFGGFLTAILFAGLAFWSISIIAFLLGSIGFLSLYFLQKKRSLRWAVQFLSSSFFILSILSFFLIGRYGTSSILWLSFAPILSGLLDSRRRGLAWGMLSIILVLALYLLDLFGYKWPDSPPHIIEGGMWIAEYIFLLVGLFSLVALHEEKTEEMNEQRRIREQSLEEHEGVLAFLSDKFPIILWSLDRKGRVVFVRGGGLERFSVEENILLGKRFIAENFPLKMFAQEIARAFKGHNVTTRFYFDQHLWKNDFSPIFDEDNKVSGVIGCTYDLDADTSEDKERSISQSLSQSSLRTEVAEPDLASFKYSSSPSENPTQTVDTPRFAKNDQGFILVIDDDTTIREELSGHLTQLGYHSFVAKDGTEGLSIAQNNQISVILLDTTMLVSGWEILSLFKADAKLMNIPVVMLLSSYDEPRPDFSYAAGFLVKPIETKPLMMMLDTIQRHS